MGLLNFFLGACWSTLNWMRRFFYQKGTFKQTKLPIRVVSVGNIEVGGTGKTPVILEILKKCQAQGVGVWVLSRGYGGRWEDPGGIVYPSTDPRYKKVFPSFVGDEVALIHEHFPNVPLGVGKNRIQSFLKLKEELQVLPDWVLLDDGFQHLQVFRDLDVVLVTSRTRFQVLYREWMWGLKKTPHLLWMWTKGKKNPFFSDGKNLHKHLEVQFVISNVLNSQDRFWLICGVGNPKEVLLSVQQKGVQLERVVSFPDHARYVLPVIEMYLKEAKNKGIKILTTHKDAVKWKELGVDLNSSQIVVLQLHMEWQKGLETWNKLLFGI